MMGKRGSNQAMHLSNILPILVCIISIQLACIHQCNSFSMSSNNGGNNSNSDHRHLSASQRARREEERRRTERQNEAMPGKTSAIPGAKDYEINVHKTENEWLNQASGSEREVKEFTTKGLEALRMLKLEEADAAFDSVYRLKPHAYCWQAGVVKFYLGDLHNAAECFAHNAALYESRFGQTASEERIWRDACELKIVNSPTSSKGRKRAGSLSTPLKTEDGLDLPIAQVRERNEDALLGPKETRKVIRIARDLFSSSIDEDLSNVALARAKLRSVCGAYDNSNNDSGGPRVKADKKMWRMNSWYYLGLHYDVLGDVASSRDCMKMALRQCASSGNSNDIIQTLPVLHMARRDWFDDEDFVEDTGNLDGDDSDNLAFSADDAIKSIQDSVGKMKLVELQKSLKTRGLKTSGSKSTLRDRLLESLLEDARLM